MGNNKNRNRTIKTLTALMLSAHAMSPVAAQENKNKSEEASTQKQSVWSIKPQMGMTAATLSGNDADDLKSKMSWNGGIEAEYRLNSRIGLSFGLLYTNTGCKEKGVTRSYYIGDPYPAEEMDQHSDMNIDYINNEQPAYTFQYVSVPLMINAYIVKGLSLKLGIQPMFKVGANRTARVWGYFKQPGNPNAEYLHYDDENKEGISEALNTANLAIPLGLSYEWKNVFVDARYHFGITDVMKSVNAKNRYLSVNLGYRFEI